MLDGVESRITISYEGCGIDRYAFINTEVGDIAIDAD
jgi:hypothetical protein